MDPSQDPTIRQLREKVSDVDRGLVEAINARLRLVAQLKSYKDARGFAFVDPEREEWMFRDVSRASRRREQDASTIKMFCSLVHSH